MRKSSMLRRAGMILLAMILAVEFIPGMDGAFAYANEDGAARGDCAYEEEVVKLSDAQIRVNREKAEAELKEELGIVDEGAIDPASEEIQTEMDAQAEMCAQEAEPFEAAKAGEADVPEAEGVMAAGPAVKPVVLGTYKGSIKPQGADAVKSGEGAKASPAGQSQDQSSDVMSAAGTDELEIIEVSDPVSGKVTVSGADVSAAGILYDAIYVGNDPDDLESTELVAELTGNDRYSFSKTIDMKQFEIGFHTVYVTFYFQGEGYYTKVGYVPTYIYKKATNKLSFYYTKKKSITFKYSGSTHYDKGPGEYLDAYMVYKRADRGDWSKKAYLASDGERKVSGLKPNTAYFTMMMFGKDVNYNGETYFFTGYNNPDKRYVSKKKKVLTAYNKPKVKKIDISNVKTIVKKYRVHYANRIRYRIYSNGVRKIISVTPLYHTYRYYYTKYKITVKFKKKQNVAAVRIGTIKGLYAWKKGDKKKYSQTFRVNGKKKGKKVTVTVQSVRSKTYGGFSGRLKKKVRCR